MVETNEPTNTTNDTGNEPNNDTSQAKPLSLVEEAKAIRDDIIKAKDELKNEREKLEKVQSEALLSGSAGGHVETEPAVETPSQYRQRIEKELAEGKYK